MNRVSKLVFLMMGLCLGMTLPAQATTINIANGNIYDELEISPASKLPIAIS